MIRKFTVKKVALAAVIGIVAPVFSSVAVGQEEKERFFESQYRHDVMEHFNYSMKKLVPILLKGQGDRAHLPAIASIMASTASISKSAFEKDTRGMEGHTDTKDDVWENWNDFSKRMDALEKDTAAFAEVTARTTDADEILAAFKNVGRNCKGCHDEYKAD